MAKRFGPYSQYAISEDGRFFGFDENDDNLLRFKMSSDVAEAIQEAFTLIRDEKPLGVRMYWPAMAQSTIEYYSEIFKNAEVIPYVYYLENQVSAPAASNLVPQNFAVNSACVSDAVVQAGATKKMAFSAGFDDDGDVLPFTAFENTANTFSSHYFNGGSNNANILRQCSLATKENHSSLVTKPVFRNIDDFRTDMSLTWKNYKSTSSLFNTTGTIVDPFDIDSLYTTTEMKSKFPGMKTLLHFETYDNSNDGTYTQSNPRTEAGTLLVSQNLSTGTNPFTRVGSNQNNLGLNSFVFFVKTYAPWYDETTGEIDDSRDAVQYWCFNVMALLAQRWFTGQFSFTWGWAEQPTGYGVNRDNYKDNSFVGLGVQCETRLNYGPIQQCFYIPFTWYLKQNTRFFNSSVVIGNYSTWNTGAHDQSDWTFELATQNGSSIGFFDNVEMLDFLVNGLGLPATFDDEELLHKPVKDWERDFPSGDVPGAGGQIGGLTGGGNGSGIGETFEDVGAPSSSTRGTYTQSSYILNETNMKHLQEAMVNDSLWAAITNMFKNNPQDGVINLIRFPVDFGNLVTINNEDVTILGVNISEMGESGYVRGTKIPAGITTAFDLGSFDFPERFGTFLDFEPYTKTTLFLPFIGFKNISTDAVIGRRIRIHYDIDYSDGSCVCVVRVSNKRTTGTDFSGIETMGFTPLYSFDGQIGQVIPLTQNNAQQKNQSLIKNALTATASIGVGVATGGMGAAAAVAGVSSAVMNAANTLLDKTQHSTGGTISSQQAYAINDLTPFVVIDFPEVNIPNGFQQYSGYITNLFQKMSSMRGFTQFDNVKITGINCTADEEKELVNLLESGVIINE